MRSAEDYKTFKEACGRAAHDPAVYRRAAEIIRTTGMVKGAFAANGPQSTFDGLDITDPSATCYCIMGALTLAGLEAGHFTAIPAENPDIPHQTDASDYGFGMVSDATQVMALPNSANYWNNLKATTTEDVIKALERGADNLETIQA